MLFYDEAPIIIWVVYSPLVRPPLQVRISLHLTEFWVLHLSDFWEVVAERAERGEFIILEAYHSTERTSPAISGTRCPGKGLDPSLVAFDVGNSTAGFFPSVGMYPYFCCDFITLLNWYG